MDSSLPSSQAWATYRAFLWGQWPRRTRQLAQTALMGSAFLLLADVLSVALGASSASQPLAVIIGVRLMCLLLPVATIGVLDSFPEWKASARPGMGLTCLW